MEEADAVIAEGVALKPNDPWIYSVQASHYEKTGRDEKAKLSWQEAIKVNANIPEFHCNYHFCQRRLGMLEESAKSARRGHELGMKTRN